MCGQTSAPSAVLTSYVGPTIRSVTGPGAVRANTEGGQIVTIAGDEFGPVTTGGAAPSSPVVQWVRYGTPGVLQFAAPPESCYVVAARPSPQMQCLTGPGTGAGHWWQVNVGGQDSNVLAANTSYSPPVLSYFTGPGANGADTRGGPNASVTVQGLNFGTDMALVNVSYVSFMKQPRTSDGVVPGSPPGTAVYRPTCSLAVAHRSLLCELPPGAGMSLEWTIIVDGQYNVAPTTSFAAPQVATVSLRGGATRASTDGGDTVDLHGVNFGPSALLQAVRYGPTGTEYTASNVTYFDHTWVAVTLAASRPGITSVFTLTAADQTSATSAQVVTYADPLVVSISPRAADTLADSSRPVVVTIVGQEFGLMDANADVAVALGNAADGTLLPLVPVLSRSPTLTDVASPTWPRPPSPIPQSVTFILPEGIGANRTVRVVAYPRGTPPTLVAVAAMATQGPAAVFSYNVPVIAWVVVDTITDAATLALVQASFPPGANLTSVRRLSINGRSFGPPQARLGDSVRRSVEAVTDFGNGTVVADSTPFVWFNWTHTSIAAYTLMGAATLRVRLVARDEAGAADVVQLSNLYNFADISPGVSALLSAPCCFPTVGGSQINFYATGLATTTVLNVTVGGGRCVLLTGQNGAPVPEASAKSVIIDTQGQVNQWPSDFQWSIWCAVPPGQGLNVPILVVRDGLRSGGTFFVGYASPNVSAVGVWDDNNGAVPTRRGRHRAHHGRPRAHRGHQPGHVPHGDGGHQPAAVRAVLLPAAGRGGTALLCAQPRHFALAHVHGVYRARRRRHRPG
jgi:hypothetical protein